MNNNMSYRLLLSIWILVICFVCIYPMKLCPIWNGEIPQQRNEYEEMAQALYEGHIWLDIPVSDSLLEASNPYDPNVRSKLHIDAKWDHAYYKGHYYMYFGIVPALMLFLPYLIVTGSPLTTYHATQFFTVFIILGLFALFDLIHKSFAPKMSRAVYVLSATAFSLASVWYFADAPALYCTAISSGVCMMIWSFYFGFRAAYGNSSPGKKTLSAILSALLGALCFGCRPPVALYNLISLTFICLFLKKTGTGKIRIKKAAAVLLPYVIIGIALMLYNYLRFDNPFEFGQKYQITLADQSQYSLFSADLKSIRSGFYELLLKPCTPTGLFPYVSFGGIFAEFPVFLVAPVFILLSSKTRKKISEYRLWGVILSGFASLFAIIYFEVSMSPEIIERYHTDLYFVLGILTFIVVCMVYSSFDGKMLLWIGRLWSVLCIMTCLCSVLLFFVPHDKNLMDYIPEYLEHLQAVMPRIGLLLQ